MGTRGFSPRTIGVLSRSPRATHIAIHQLKTKGVAGADDGDSVRGPIEQVGAGQDHEAGRHRVARQPVIVPLALRRKWQRLRRQELVRRDAREGASDAEQDGGRLLAHRRHRHEAEARTVHTLSPALAKGAEPARLRHLRGGGSALKGYGGALRGARREASLRTGERRGAHGLLGKREQKGHRPTS